MHFLTPSLYLISVYALPLVSNLPSLYHIFFVSLPRLSKESIRDTSFLLYSRSLKSTPQHQDRSFGDKKLFGHAVGQGAD